MFKSTEVTSSLYDFRMMSVISSWYYIYKQISIIFNWMNRQCEYVVYSSLSESLSPIIHPSLWPVPLHTHTHIYEMGSSCCKMALRYYSSDDRDAIHQTNSSELVLQWIWYGVFSCVYIYKETFSLSFSFLFLYRKFMALFL